MEVASENMPAEKIHKLMLDLRSSTNRSMSQRNNGKSKMRAEDYAVMVEDILELNK